MRSFSAYKVELSRSIYLAHDAARSHNEGCEEGGGRKGRRPEDDASYDAAAVEEAKRCVGEFGCGSKMILAACCMAFFGFLRAGEMTVPDDGAFDKCAYLGFGDIAIDNPSSPSFVRVRIKQSKTGSVDLFLGRTHTDLCPVARLSRCPGGGAMPPVQFCEESVRG